MKRIKELYTREKGTLSEIPTKALLTVAVMIFTISFIIGSASADPFPTSTLHHEYDRINVFDGCSYYTIENFDQLVILTDKTLDVSTKIELIGNIKNERWEWQYNEPYTASVLHNITPYELEVCEVNNITEKNICHTENLSTYYFKNEIRYRKVWQSYDSFEGKIFRQKIQWVRFCADIERERTENGFEILVDIIPKYNNMIYYELNWWNSAWLKKRPIDIFVTSGTTRKDYQVLINVTFDSDMEDDFRDLRFLNGSEDTELNYSFDFIDNSSYADVYVKVDQNISTVNYTIYMYYDNSLALSNSDPLGVFELYDDFEDSILDPKWTLETRNFDKNGTEENGYFNLSGVASSQHWRSGNSITGTTPFGRSGSGWSMKADLFFNEVNADFDSGFGLLIMWSNDTSSAAISEFTADTALNAMAWDGTALYGAGGNGGPDTDTFTGSLSAYTDSTTREVEMIWNTSDDTLYYFDDLGNTVNNPMTGWSGNAELYARAGPLARAVGDIIEVHLDNISVRKYHAPEPDSVIGPEMIESAINIVFVSQTPIDITSTNLMNETANITYNVSGTNLNSSTIRLEIVVNSSSGISFIHVNGISRPLNLSFPFLSNNTIAFLTTLDDNDIYPGSYTIEEDTMEDSAHIAYVAANNNRLIKTTLLNITNSSAFSFLEIMTNSSSSSCTLYYCNSSYTTGAITSTPNCGGFGSISPNTPYNHTHPGSGGSSHVYVPLGLDTTTGTISDVQVTPTSQIVVKGSGCNTFYINNNTLTTQTSNNNGGAWSNETWTVDVHIHQFSNDTLYYRQCANDTLGAKTCSDLRFDNLDVTPLPPSAPVIITPQEGEVSGEVNITYEECISPIGNAINFYNISLLLSNFTFFQAITSNNSLNLSFLWNTSLVPDDDYIIEVTCFDNQSLSTNAFSGTITVLNNVTILIPESTFFCSSDTTFYTRIVDIETDFFTGEENITISETFFRCPNGCSNQSLSNFFNPGCIQNDIINWIYFIIMILIMVGLFKVINK